MNAQRILLLILILFLLAAIPLTVYFLQKRQETRSRATPATTLSFCKPGSSPCSGNISGTVGQNFDTDIIVNPGSNQVFSINLTIVYDPTKFATAGAGFVSNSAAFPSILEGPTYSAGSISVTLSTGSDFTKAIQTITKAATVTFQGVAPVIPSSPNLLFGSQTQVLSVASTDQPNENVLATTNGGTVTIAQGSATPTPTSPPTTPTANQPPVCTTLNVDRATTGAAPFSLAFTANGNDPDGTITKVSFNFGDGPVQDVIQGGGIGTKTVSVQASHTYNNPATFTASATLTDDKGTVSQIGPCSQTITVTGTAVTPAPGGATATPAPAASPTTTPVPTPLATVTPRPAVSVTPPGPGDIVLGIGAVGAVLAVIGAILFFAL